MPLRMHSLVLEGRAMNAEAHLDFAAHTALGMYRHVPPTLEPSDLQQAGIIGLIEASQRYKPESGVPFHIYAKYRIRGAVRDAVRAADWWSRGARAQEKKTGIAVENPLSLDYLLCLGNEQIEASFLYVLSADDPQQDVFLLERLCTAFRSLPERQQTLLRLYYREGRTMQEIGVVLDVQESRVSQMHTEALAALRRRLECA